MNKLENGLICDQNFVVNVYFNSAAHNEIITTIYVHISLFSFLRDPTL